jgi:hypothetical protein
MGMRHWELHDLVVDSEHVTPIVLLLLHLEHPCECKGANCEFGCRRKKRREGKGGKKEGTLLQFASLCEFPFHSLSLPHSSTRRFRCPLLCVAG